MDTEWQFGKIMKFCSWVVVMTHSNVKVLNATELST